MPSCRVTNYTSQPLNVSLKHLCAVHFENEVAPGQTVKLKPGRVWFTLEVLVDDKDNRYSMAQSAAAIAIVSLACVGTAAVAIPAAAAAVSGAAVGSTVSGAVSSVVVAGGTGLVAIGDTLLAGFGAAYTTAGAFLGAHAATAAKISAAFLPKAIEVVEKEVGGFTSVQKEVIAILSSPNVTEEVRNSGMSILGRLGIAVAADRAAAAAEAEKENETKNKSGPNNISAPPPPYSKDAPSTGTGTGTSTPSSAVRPSLKRMQTSVSTLMNKLSNESRTERKVAKREAKDAKEVASWEVVDANHDDGGMLSSKERLRVHGLFMNERRHYEVREKDGKLVLMDANTREIVVG
jgi:hypothetical protein